jgi:long-chain acyl-CoA synthetase
MATAAPELFTQRIRRVALGDILHRSARRFGERAALIDGEHRLSYRELNEASNRFAHHLLGLGLLSGDRVGMLCANSAQMVIAIFGIHKAGLTWVPVNNTLAPDSIGYILEHAEVRRMIMDVGFFAKPELQSLLRAKGIEPLLTVVPGDSPPVGVPTLAEAITSGPATAPDVAIAGDQLAFIMYTSGTTGKQKGVMHSHESASAALLSNAVEWGCIAGADTWSGVLPLFHIGQYSILMTAMVTGGTVVLLRGFDPGVVLDAIEQHKITITVGLPMMYGAMLAHPSRPARNLSSLRLCLYAMAPMSKSMLLKLHEDGRLLGPGGVGEIVFRGPNVMLGYYKDPEATANVQRFGWHHTGDLGTWDNDGQLLFLDRLKDMIKSGGENVPSIKVEEVLLRHPAVLNVAVVGLPHDRWGEAITAFVTVKPGAQAATHELISHCKSNLGSFEVPKDIIFLGALPMTSTGKIQKFELRRAHLEHYQTG